MYKHLARCQLSVQSSSNGTPTVWAQLFPRSSAMKDDLALDGRLNVDQCWDALKLPPVVCCELWQGPSPVTRLGKRWFGKNHVAVWLLGEWNWWKRWFGVVTSLNHAAVWLLGDWNWWQLPYDVWECDGGAERPSWQRHGCTRSLRLRPTTQLETHGRWERESSRFRNYYYYNYNHLTASFPGQPG